jgi:sugar lactone lactonase YvrE
LAWGLSLRSLAKALISLAIGASVFGQTYTIQTIAGGAFPVDGRASSAVLGLIGGMAIDSSGNLYVALHSSHMVVKVDVAGNMTRIAGTGVYGFSGDGGSATGAQLAYPQGLVFDKSGNLYIQDGGNQRVRMVSGGIISTVPGTAGLLGVTEGIYFGETTGLNSLPVLSSLALLPGMAVNSKGVLYVSDTINNRVFKVTGGVASVIAGTGEPGYSGDGAISTSGQLNHPFGLAVDSLDTLFIADTHNNRIREILASSGKIYTLCGLGQPYYLGDEGLASNAYVNNPIGLAIDSGDNLYIADSANFVIRKIWKASHQAVVNGVSTTVQANTIETVAGSGTTGPFPVPDGTGATVAMLGVPAALAVDAAGNAYFSDVDHHRVMVMSAAGVVSTVVGGGAAIGDNGPAASAQLVLPFGVAADSKGNVYSLDMGRNGVRRILNGTISTIAGNGIFGGAGDYGPAPSAQLAAVGIASDAVGNLFLATSGNYLAAPNGGRIREVTGGNMFSVAGTGQAGSDGDGGLASNAQFSDPMGVAVDAAGNFYIADTYNYRVRKVSAQDKNISTIAGNGTPGYGGDGSAATSAQIGRPFRIAVDAAGNTYIADFDNNVIRKVDATTGIIKTFAGTGTAGYSGDNGPAASAQINRPSALAVNPAGDLFFFDLGNSVLRKVSASNGVVTTVAGNGIRGYSGDNGPALGAMLGSSYGIAADASGKIYLADVDNSVLRVLTTGTSACSYTVSPLASQVDASGGNVTLTFTTGSSCAWSLPALPIWITATGSTSGTGTASVSLVVAANPGAARNASLTVAGSTVTISEAGAACTYVISPAGQFLAAAGGNGTFQVTTNSGCSWTVTSVPSWVTLSAASTGSGSGTVAYQVALNAGAAREGMLSIAGTAYEIDQSSSGITGLTSTGSLAHFASAGGWNTTFTLVNTGTSAATAQLDFTGDNGSAIVLPLSLPQTNQTGLSGATIQQALAAGAVLPIESAGLISQTPLTGVAQLMTTGNVGGFAVFTYQPSPESAKQEAVVPLETRNASSYVLAFDNTNGYSTGIAVSNTSAQTVTIQVTIRDGSGAFVKSRALTLLPAGHTAFTLTDAVSGYTETANMAGTLQFTTPSAGQISVLGIRVNPQHSFTSVPALVPGRLTSAGSGLVNAGSIAHFASGGGYKTTFTLVNTGTFAARAKLSFFDDNGAAVTLPLSLPQKASTGQSGAAFEQSIAGGATLIVESEGPASLDAVTGSAQLQTDGDVSGFAVFSRSPLDSKPQEAVVPLETRDGTSYVLAYDNTNGYLYGIAVANTSSQPASITVTIRDAKTGAVTGSPRPITLPANGHEAFLLNDVTHGFPETANTSGTLEFSTAAAGQISVLGLRFNPNAAFTSVPVLLKQ